MQQALLHWQRTLLKEGKLVLEYGGKLTKLLHQLQDAEPQKKQYQHELEPLLAEPDYTVEDDSEWQKAARANEDKIEAITKVKSACEKGIRHITSSIERANLFLDQATTRRTNQGAELHYLCEVDKTTRTLKRGL